MHRRRGRRDFLGKLWFNLSKEDARWVLNAEPLFQTSEKLPGAMEVIAGTHKDQKSEKLPKAMEVAAGTLKNQQRTAAVARRPAPRGLPHAAAITKAMEVAAETLKDQQRVAAVAVPGSRLAAVRRRLQSKRPAPEAEVTAAAPDQVQGAGAAVHVTGSKVHPGTRPSRDADKSAVEAADPAPRTSRKANKSEHVSDPVSSEQLARACGS